MFDIFRPKAFLFPSKVKPLSVLLCGYYGEGNLGDELLLELILDLMDPRIYVYITSNDLLLATLAGPNRKRINRKNLIKILLALDNVDYLILGGGSLLQDKTSKLSFYIIFAVILSITSFYFFRGNIYIGIACLLLFNMTILVIEKSSIRLLIKGFNEN